MFQGYSGPFFQRSLVAGRKDLFETWPTVFFDSPESFEYPPPIEFGGPVRSRIDEFTKPIRLEPPFVRSIPDVKLAGEFAFAFTTSGKMILETNCCGRATLGDIIPSFLSLARSEIDLAFSLIHPRSVNVFVGYRSNYPVWKRLKSSDPRQA